MIEKFRHNFVLSYQELDEQLRPYLVAIGQKGLEADRDRVEGYMFKVNNRLNQLTSELAPTGIKNPNSHQQVKNWLSAQGIETKSVAQEILESLLPEVPQIGDILAYRRTSKLWSFLKSFLNNIDLDGRIRYEFKIDHETTGRIYVTNFNLQQLPPSGRDCIFPDSGLFTVFDYKQFDLRLLAADSGDDTLCKSFLSGYDPYILTAKRLFNTEEVTEAQRGIAKVVNLAASYGTEPRGLSFNLGITIDQATEILDRFKSIHQGLIEFSKEVQDKAIVDGYAENRFGRRMKLDVSNEPQARRQAIAMRGQGGSAGVLRRRLLSLSLSEIPWVMTVHDSVVLDSSDSAVTKSVDKILNEPIEILNGPFKGDFLPLQTKVTTGETWGLAGHREELESDKYGIGSL